MTSFRHGLLAAFLLLGSPASPAGAVAGAADSEADAIATARGQIADVAKGLDKEADTIKHNLELGELPADDLPLELMRYATFRVAAKFFRTWSEDKKLVRPTTPKCFLEDAPAEPSLATQIAGDELLIGFVQDGHLLEVASGLASDICQASGPQIVRPMIKEAENRIPPSLRPSSVSK